MPLSLWSPSPKAIILAAKAERAFVTPHVHVQKLHLSPPMFMCMDAEISRRKAREAHPLKREPFEGSLAAGGEDARRGARIVPPAPALRRRRVARCAPRACGAARPLAARRRLPHPPPRARLASLIRVHRRRRRGARRPRRRCCAEQGRRRGRRRCCRRPCGVGGGDSQSAGGVVLAACLWRVRAAEGLSRR